MVRLRGDWTRRCPEGRGISQVVVVGLATSFGVESTARAAYDLGYDVILPVDAMTDIAVEAHENSIRRTFPALGRTTTTDELIAALSA
jgi:nicotinamidase-related amidase